MSPTDPATPGDPDRLIDPLPSRARLLHVGLPKSGTTYMQRSAAASREALLAHGVRYPGSATSHRLPILALMGTPLGWGGAEMQPEMRRWNRVLAEVEADTERRIYLSNEAATLCDDEQAERFSRALGPRMHVLITLRGFTSLLASNWQQRIKTGSKISLDRWLKAVLAEHRTGIGANDYARVDLAGVVTRWVKLAGPENVTVIIADKRRRTLLTDVLSDLLDLPRDVLDAKEASGFSANRSLSMPEVEMLRAMNAVVRRRHRTDWAQYSELVRQGATARMLSMRTPTADETPVLLPEWAVRVAEPLAREHAAAVLASGCRIVGDPDELLAPVMSVPVTPRIDAVPVNAAAEALAGLVSAATGRRAFFGVDALRADPTLGADPAEGYGRVWAAPAAVLGLRREPDVTAGRLGRLAGEERALALNRGYLQTRDIPPSRLVAIAALRVARRMRPGGRRRA